MLQTQQSLAVVKKSISTYILWTHDLRNWLNPTQASKPVEPTLFMTWICITVIIIITVIRPSADWVSTWVMRERPIMLLVFLPLWRQTLRCQRVCLWALYRRLRRPQHITYWLAPSHATAVIAILGGAPGLGVEATPIACDPSLLSRGEKSLCRVMSFCAG